MALHYLTQEGLDKLKKELSDALSQRPVIAAAIAEAREKGDLSENAEYESARDAQVILELNIARLQDLLANSRVIDASKLTADKVGILSKVTVKNINLGREMKFTIVGEHEANFAEGKLADTTPIGKALMGHKVGDIVEAQAPNGIMKFEIKEISI